MDSKSLIEIVAQRAGVSASVTSDMLEAFAGVLRRGAVTLAPVAVPSFGTWTPTKTDEEIVTDHANGKRMLLPPQITIEFKPAAMLRKKISESHE